MIKKEENIGNKYKENQNYAKRVSMILWVK